MKSVFNIESVYLSQTSLKNILNIYSQSTIKLEQPISWNSLGKLFCIHPWRKNFAGAYLFSHSSTALILRLGKAVLCFILAQGSGQGYEVVEIAGDSHVC